MQLAVNLSSEVPIYVQVKNQLRLAVERGELLPGAQVPTVRDLAVQLSINANTVARVYADLEREGYLVRKRGIGTFVAERPSGAAGGNASGSGRKSTGGKADTGGGVASVDTAHLAEALRQLSALGYSTDQLRAFCEELLAGIGK